MNFGRILVPARLCPLSSYWGYLKLKCHLRLKDTQCSGPDCHKTLYVTAPVASLSFCLQVIAIIIVSTLLAQNSRDYNYEFSSDSIRTKKEYAKFWGWRWLTYGTAIDSERTQRKLQRNICTSPYQTPTHFPMESELEPFGHYYLS
jgi:hypothetical protein